MILSEAYKKRLKELASTNEENLKGGLADIENIILEVYTNNKIAISLYEKIGFRVLLYPKSNVIKMIKKI